MTNSVMAPDMRVSGEDPAPGWDPVVRQCRRGYDGCAHRHVTAGFFAHTARYC